MALTIFANQCPQPVKADITAQNGASGFVQVFDRRQR
jgi:hypothetical protein